MRHLGLEVLAWISVDEVENTRQADVGQGQPLTHQPGLKGKHDSFQGESVLRIRIRDPVRLLF